MFLGSFLLKFLKYFKTIDKFNISNLDLINNTFKNNFGSTEGGVIKITGMIVNSRNCTFINNTSPYGNEIASYPVKMALNEKNTPKNISQKSPINYLVDGQVTGSSLTETLYFNVLDFYDQIVTTIDNEIAQISLANFNKTEQQLEDFSFVGKESVIIQNGEFIYDNITLYSDPPDSILTLVFVTDVIDNVYITDNQSASKMNLSRIQPELRPDLSFSTSDIEVSGTYQFLVDIKMRSCVAGEVYNKVSKSCSRCSYKTYSYHPDDSSCTDCPQNCVCLGGTQLMLNPGYWRSNNKTTVIHQCVPLAASCL